MQTRTHLSELVITLPWTAPVLRSNDRDHWRERARKAAEVRQAVGLLARGKRIEPPVIATLIWTVTNDRRRDAGAASPTLKAALDGLVDAGVIPDDNHRYVVEERCRIERGRRAGVAVVLTPAGNADSRPPARSLAGEQEADVCRDTESLRIDPGRLGGDAA